MKPQLIRWAPLAAVPAALAGWRLDPAGFLAGYLVAWWFWMSLCLGVLANTWLHTLTGGAWGEGLRTPLIALAPSVPVAALLFLPVLAGLRLLYPWSEGFTTPGFKQFWLAPSFFTGRALAYLALWSALAWFSRRPVSRGAAAAALIAFGLSVSLAAFDWIMSLMPLWYSSVFGLLCCAMQMLAGMALAVLYAAPPLLTDLGNLLLMYVLCWAYLEYVQLLIIWEANLPHEIVWYLARSHGPWLVVDWLLAVFLFAVPLVMLLQRRLKRHAPATRRLALLVLAMVFVHAAWLILPSLPGAPSRWLSALPLAMLTMAALATLPFGWRRRIHG